MYARKLAKPCGIAVWALSALVAPFASAHAETLSFECKGPDNGRPMSLSLVYEGDAAGTLAGTTSFGALSLKATKQTGEEAFEGKSRKVVLIDAGGTANVAMPGPAAFEACLAAKKSAEDEDGTLAVLACHASVADGASPIAADVFIKIMIDPLVFVDSAAEVRRRFPDESAALGRKVTLEALPPLDCTSNAKP